MRDNGFDLLVLCAREHQFIDDHEAFQGLTVVRAPNDDSVHYPLTREKLRTAVGASSEVVRALKANQQVLVTCAAGLNRSGLVTALSLHKLYGWSGEKCIAAVRKGRKSKNYPHIKPLSNSEFQMALRKLKAKEPEPQPAELESGWGWSDGGLIIPVRP